MTERTETTTEREYDTSGNLIKETVTTVVEKDDGIQRYPFNNPYFTYTVDTATPINDVNQVTTTTATL